LESEQMDKTPLISVVIPAYNEADGIEKTIERVESILEKQFDSYEIIIVDDGSCDGTPEKIEKAIEKNFRIKLIRLTRNFGKESALSADCITAQEIWLLRWILIFSILLN